MTMMRRAFHLSRMVARAAAPALRSPLPALSQPSISRASMFQVPRNFSSGEQLKEAYVRVPIPMFGVTGNYASALYIAAVKAGKLTVVQSELKSVMEAAKTSPSFQNFIKDLSIQRKIRVKAVIEIFAEAGFSDITKNFLAVVAEHGRLRLLEGIMKKFTSLTKAHFGEVDAIVTTVIPLPEKEEKELKQLLQNKLNEIDFRPMQLPEEEEMEFKQLKEKKYAAGETQLPEKELEKFNQLVLKKFLSGRTVKAYTKHLPEEEEKELKQLVQKKRAAGGTELPEKEQTKFIQLVRKTILAERTVSLHQKIDRSILGGVVIEFEDKLIDLSIKTRLKKMEDSIRNAPAELLDI